MNDPGFYTGKSCGETSPFLSDAPRAQEGFRELLSADQAATMAGMARRTWYRFVASGRAPQPVRPGGTLTRWRRSDLLAWITAGCPRVVERKGVDR